MKRKNKGKIFPSPHLTFSSPLPAVQQQDGQFLSVLNLIPAAILALVAVLSLEDREVLAYMITRSLKTPTGSGTVFSTSTKKLSSRNAANGGGNDLSHRPPLFHCECFDCYTAYWFRWDSSPNRELIHRAIEAFEEHLATGEQVKENIRGKRRDKGRSRSELGRPEPQLQMPLVEEILPEVNGVVRAEEESVVWVDEIMLLEENGVLVKKREGTYMDGSEMQAAAGTRNDHKGLARKVLPDVVGLLNSRLWKLWNPSI